MENTSKHYFGYAIALAIMVWGFVSFEKLNDRVDELAFENEVLQDTVYSYEDALSEANSNIEQCNANIEDAQVYAWESYDEMGEALDYLETVDTVDEPY